MKILSWDVGIYNLSYCILEKVKETDENNETIEKIKIIGWDIVNLVDNEEMKKNRNLLFENIPRKLYEITELLNVDIVIIENQPSLKNPQMKSIQMILYSYFLILGKVIGDENNNNNGYISTIDFCSASNKLKIYDGPEIVLEKKTRKNEKKIKVEEIKVEEIKIEEMKEEEIKEEENKTKKESNKKKGSSLKYSDKKKLAVEHAKYFLTRDNLNYLDFFNNSTKKDDLADSYLQGLYYIKKNKI